MTATLYLSRTGMLEPLGQSQVLSYLRGLSRDYQVTLISFERANDLANTTDVARIEQFCATHNIRWLHATYRRRPRLFASTWNLLVLFWLTWRETRRQDARLIHARAYIPAAAAWAVSKLTGVPWIFDMRSLWPEELITSRRLRRGSLLHHAIVGMEGRMLADAAVVISLTRAALVYLRATHPGALDEARTTVIPTCTDLARFRIDTAAAQQDRAVLIGCHGSIVTGWFRADLLAQVFAGIAARVPNAHFEIITRDPPEAVMTALGGGVGFADRLRIFSAPPSEIHGYLTRQSLSVLFYEAGSVSELGRSPTRMGEALACGVPILANDTIGDVRETLEDGGVGIVLGGDDPATITRAIEQALALAAEPDIAARCRAVAERIYSLDAGTEQYRSVYRRLTAAGQGWRRAGAGQFGE